MWVGELWLYAFFSFLQKKGKVRQILLFWAETKVEVMTPAEEPKAKVQIGLATTDGQKKKILKLWATQVVVKKAKKKARLWAKWE